MGEDRKQLTRITFEPEIMGGKPCIRGLRVTVGMIVGLAVFLDRPKFGVYHAKYTDDKFLSWHQISP